jgi:hypothetical protein
MERDNKRRNENAAGEYLIETKSYRLREKYIKGRDRTRWKETNMDKKIEYGDKERRTRTNYGGDTCRQTDRDGI